MPTIAVIGAGELGGAVASRVARLDRVARVLVVDRERGVAEGTALDIQQAAPIEGFRTTLEAADDPGAARGAAVIVIAPAARPGAADQPEALVDWMVRLISPREPTVVVFAEPSPLAVMERAIGERGVTGRRLVGSAPLAFASAVRALVAAAIDRSPSQIALSVAGRPPEPLVLWSGATIDGSPLEQAVDPAVVAGIRRRLPALWPPGPQALASAAARVAVAVAAGSRRLFPCWVGLEDPPAARGRVAAVPVELGPQGIIRLVPPAMSPHERVLVDNALRLAVRRA